MKGPLSLLAIKSKLISVLSNYFLKIQLFEQIKKSLKIKIFLVVLIKIEYSIYSINKYSIYSIPKMNAKQLC